MPVDRRNMIGGAIAATLAVTKPRFAEAQQLKPVVLLVLRQPGVLSNHCIAPCIRGAVYNVSNVSNLDVDKLVLPAVKALPPIVGVVERPFQNNKPNVSSVPKGIYKASIRTDKTKEWMNTENRRWRLELAGVPNGRTAIQFHYGKDVDWSRGCFIVGDLLSFSGAQTKEKYCRLEESEDAVGRLRAAIEQPGANLNDIKIAVADDGGLFPDLSSNPICA